MRSRIPEAFTPAITDTVQCSRRCRSFSLGTVASRSSLGGCSVEFHMTYLCRIEECSDDHLMRRKDFVFSGDERNCFADFLIETTSLPSISREMASNHLKVRRNRWSSSSKLLMISASVRLSFRGSQTVVPLMSSFMGIATKTDGAWLTPKGSKAWRNGRSRLAFFRRDRVESEESKASVRSGENPIPEPPDHTIGLFVN